MASSVPTLAAILLLPPVLYRLLPPGGCRATPGATTAAREALRSLGPLGRDEKIVAVAFALMVTGWIMARTLSLGLTAVAFADLGPLLATSVLTVDDIAQEGGTLATHARLAVLFALSGQLNELGFIKNFVGRPACKLEDVPWSAAFVALRIVLYVLMHYLFVSQSSQVLALFSIFMEVGASTGVPTPLLAFSLLFASSYFHDHAAGRQPERHLRGQWLSDPGRALPGGRAHHGGVPADLPPRGHAMAPSRGPLRRARWGGLSPRGGARSDSPSRSLSEKPS